MRAMPIAPVAERYKRLLGKTLANTCDLFICNVPYDHGIGGVAEFAVTYDEPEPLDDAAIDQRAKPLNDPIFTPANAVCDFCIRARYDRQAVFERLQQRAIIITDAE